MRLRRRAFLEVLVPAGLLVVGSLRAAPLEPAPVGPAPLAAAPAAQTSEGGGPPSPEGAAGPRGEARAAVSPVPPAPAAVAVGPGAGGLPADVVREARAVAEGREPAALQHGDDLQVPYGHQVPVLRCAPLRVCLIELEEGEIVLNTVTGDSARWILDRAVAGPHGATAILAVKPTGCDLTTNLIVTTTRRIYQVTLDARPCREGENPIEPYTRLLRFYYPDELVRRWASEEEAERDAARAERQSTLPLTAGVPLAALHFQYRWSRAGRYPWTPVAVFDDRVHTYIRLPEGAGGEAPLLFAIDEKGNMALVNYAVQGQTYVTDRVLQRAALVLGSGREQRRLDITRER